MWSSFPLVRTLPMPVPEPDDVTAGGGGPILAITSCSCGDSSEGSRFVPPTIGRSMEDGDEEAEAGGSPPAPWVELPAVLPLLFPKAMMDPLVIGMAIDRSPVLTGPCLSRPIEYYAVEALVWMARREDGSSPAVNAPDLLPPAAAAPVAAPVCLFIVLPLPSKESLPPLLRIAVRPRKRSSSISDSPPPDETLPPPPPSSKLVTDGCRPPPDADWVEVEPNPQP